MRLTSRFLGLALITLFAFWFAAENAGEMVLVDLVIFRLRISLPLLVFGSVIAGMGVSLAVGWRADRRAARRPTAPRQTGFLSDRPERFDTDPADLGHGELDPHEYERREYDRRTSDRKEWH
ncbi:MAG: hypothetical protein R3195_12455 [Gemmatimonadota bacterium]|nr:hypothetical protein [Gemmatimonadota bacterium]